MRLNLCVRLFEIIKKIAKKNNDKFKEILDAPLTDV